MAFRNDFILNQIEQASRLIAALISSKTTVLREEANMNQTLADLTGLDINLFAEPKNAAVLPMLLGMLSDDNQKAVIAKLLQLKNADLYRNAYESLLDQIDHTKLREDVKKLIA